MAPGARRWRRNGDRDRGEPGEPGGTGGSCDGPDWAALGLSVLGYTGLTALDFTGLCWFMKGIAVLGWTGLDWSLDWDSFLPPVPPAPSAAGWDKSRGHIATG